MRDKRLRETKLAGKSIAEQMAEDETDESAASWITRVRTQCASAQRACGGQRGMPADL